MSAPAIPNLLSLRGGLGRAGGGRGRRGGGPPSASASASATAQHDATIQGTDDDAAISRLSAVEIGYLGDPFARLFVPGPVVRRLPIINRGTYTRTTAIDLLVDRFLAQTAGTTADDAGQEPTRQIVSLGAGTDTRALRLFSELSSSSSSSTTPIPKHRNIAYHEIDFPAICTRKLQTVRASLQLRSILSDPVPAAPASPPTSTSTTSPSTQEDGSSSPNPNPYPYSPSSSWHSRAAYPTSNNQLWCHALDLRALAHSSSTPTSPSKITLPGLSPTLPTLLISECCLCYLSPADARAVLAYFSSHISPPETPLGLVLYEPVRPDDAFGRMMVSNLAARRIRMPTLDVYRSPQDQERRLLGDFAHARQMTVDAIWDAEGWVPEEEKERVERLEGGLDELEEWKLLAGHYIVAWGWRGVGVDLDMGV
ncbi:S-adenosyl-L-methionine-dependent methyltransferase [Bombardia bombarda]|uniref:Leucine carboxyl methyltransferase 1 n=1 Tax=Bombardia bombarda TaxID=252184 RepID=A0AA39XMN6_9PEZI|nr:S-adenosyl-L-methionine-dependent methyltransferase [Bombardia bombarda]